MLMKALVNNVTEAEDDEADTRQIMTHIEGGWVLELLDAVMQLKNIQNKYFYFESFPSILRSNSVFAEVCVLIPLLYLSLIDLST